ncbi:MAG: elongation factor EF-2 [Candidatus Helarchaeota archaeon]|nr:elongation factor EF-2 [Candidatus Helarchaeota archaeon]
MVKVKNVEEIQQMIKTHPLELRRIFSITAHIDHGKSTACDYLMGRAGLLSHDYEGERRLTDYDEEEQERGITIFTSVALLNYEFEGENYLLEINDTPGHISFTGEVSRALRGSDGAVILVDALEGCMTQTITNIHLAVGEEWCRPILFINKVDRLIMELKLPPEKIIQRFQQIIQEVNTHIKQVAPEKKGVYSFKEKWILYPDAGHVVFGSAKDGWAFTIPQIKKKGMSAKLVLDKYAEAIKTNSKEPIQWLRKNLPLDEALLNVIIKFLPSPIEAQKYRMAKLWSGDITKGMKIDDPEAIKDDIAKWTAHSLINIDKNGPLLAMITKIFIHPKTKRPTIIGRVWSGTLKQGDEIYLMNAKRSARVRRLGVMEIDSLLPVEQVPAGNLFAMELPDIQPAGETFVSLDMKDEGIPGFEKILYVSDPVVSRSIKPEDPKHLGKLGDVVRKWVLADPTATFRKNEESGEYILSGIDPLQIEILVERIQDEIPIKVGIPITVYHETLLDKGIEINTKCSEGHNKLKMYIEPLNKDTLKLIREGKISEYQDEKERAALLRDAGWDKKEARRIWAIEGQNLLVNGSMGVQRLDRIKGYIIATFRDFVFSSALAKEPAMGLKAVVTDATVHEDPTHTRSAQIFVMTFSALNISFLTANPALYEPILRVDLKTPNEYMGTIMTILTQHRGKVVDTVQIGENVEIQGEIPASEAVKTVGSMGGIADEIRSATQGKAIFGYQFEKFQLLPKNFQEEMISNIRKRKKESGQELSPEIPNPFTFKNRMYPDPGYWRKSLCEYISQYKTKIVIQKILEDVCPQR